MYLNHLLNQMLMFHKKHLIKTLQVLFLKHKVDLLEHMFELLMAYQDLLFQTENYHLVIVMWLFLLQMGLFQKRKKNKELDFRLMR